MKMSELGFDQWFQAHAEEIRDEGHDLARVSAVDRNTYLIRNELTEMPAELSGRFSFQLESAAELPCVGDWVAVQYYNDGTSAIIHGLVPRRTFLRRKRPGSAIGHQMIAANLDTAFIVQSCHFDFNLPRLNRYLVMAADGRVEPIVVLTKTDLISEDELQRQRAAITEAGITARVIALSNRTGAGFAAFRQLLLPGRTYCLLGSSGVGKTTLINQLIGRDEFKTSAVSGTGEGTHTTTRRQLLVLGQGALLIDTPGMRELGLLDAGDGINLGFADILELGEDCRFADCSHTREKGCAVLAALSSGELSEERYASFVKLRKESAHQEMSYADRRKKDKDFGRFIKTVKKNLKR